jgi:hypothetical protein
MKMFQVNTDPSDELLGQLRITEADGTVVQIGRSNADGIWHEPIPCQGDINKIRRYGAQDYYAKSIQFINSKGEIIAQNKGSKPNVNYKWTDYEIGPN